MVRLSCSSGPYRLAALVARSLDIDQGPYEDRAGTFSKTGDTDSAMSFGLIRGGHIDVTVLGGLQIGAEGHLANWMIPGKLVPGMGDAMDLVSGAKRAIVGTQHAAKGKSEIVQKCGLPLISSRPFDLVVTDIAVIGFSNRRITLQDTAGRQRCRGHCDNRGGLVRPG
jgi:3-oxoacid CoA-transferase B subunit